MSDMVLDVSDRMIVPGRRVRRKSGVDWWGDLGVSVAATQNIDEVATVWRRLEEGGIESPGQSLDYIRSWISRFDIPAHEQLYVTGEAQGRVVALLPLRREKRAGADILTWFAGAHVGCNAPLIDREAFGALSARERREVWKRMQRVMVGADLVILPFVPALEGGELFAGLGDAIEVETLYRSEFRSWDECQKVQRTRSRRKHDRQQGAKLAAMGKVSFEQLGPGDDVEEALRVMFRQKAERFKQWGIEDPFAQDRVKEFYRDLFEEPEQVRSQNKGLEPKLHVLKLDETIVSVRYNLAHKDRIFALISSMSTAPELLPGSPGKQNILRAMQAIFSGGYAVCDMGAGYSDEKRQWCNRTIPLKTHYLALNERGELVALMHRVKYRVRKFIKSNALLFDLLKNMRALVRGNRGG